MKEQNKLLYKVIRRSTDVVGAVLVLLAVLFGTGILTGQPEINGSFEEADLELGSEVFQNNCARCHGERGRQIAGDVVLQDSNLEKQEIATVVKQGRGEMPAFQDELTDEEITAVSAYVNELRQ
jgi:mono/diheme cytochrome c family protein